ncbi:MAG TPA: prepilin-type N-terminal cleavage/methylation domain-containing protein [Thermoanaerobaculia bacterium]
MTTAPVRPPQSARRKREGGFSLIEALVAITVFSVVFIVALLLYQLATGSYLRTDSAVRQQQDVRYGMDRMSETLRDAGAGHNTLGSRRVADEQIEGAWESAVFVRGDFDGERETGLENATFPIVTTGNDEIVGYVLRKPNANPYTITVKADLTGTGRDAVFTSNASITNEETKTISVAARTVAEQTSPPYQLTRVTFDASGNPQYAVIADNVRTLQFQYFPASGTTAVAVGNSGADSERDERATIRKIQTKLVGMTDRPDLQTKKDYRNFTLEQTILAVNLGVTGSKHNPQPPISLPVPESITACNGHCRNHLIRWAEADGVSVYRLQITAPATGPVGAYTNTIDVEALQYEFREPDEDIQNGVTRAFTFKVASTSGATIGSYTSSVSRTSDDDAQSVPSAPENVAGTGASDEYAMDVTWNAVTQNTGAITDTTQCVSAGSGSGGAPPMPWAQQAVDLTNSKVFRVRSTGSNIGTDAVVDVSTEKIGALENAISNTAFRDRTAAPCSAYFYRVKACDLCAKTSEYSAAMVTPSAFTVPNGVIPAKPPSAPSVVGSVTSNGTNYSVKLQWSHLTTASDGKPAATAHYVLERWRKLGAAGSYSLETSYDFYETTVSHTDTPPESVSGQNAYYRYYVKGVYDCASPRVGTLSDPYDLACTPPATNTAAITAPAPNDMFTRPTETSVPLQLTVTGTGWTGAQLSVRDLNGNEVYTPAALSGGPSGGVYTFASWNIAPTSIPDGTYTVTASATIGSCRAMAASTVFTIETTACGQRIVQAAYQGSGNNFAKSMTFKIENTCPNAVTFNRLTPAWQGVPASVRLNKILSGATTIYTNATGIASGGNANLSANQTIAAGSVLVPTVSGTYTFEFTGNFTSDASKNGTPGKFNSVVANVISPTLTPEQLVDGVPIP